MLNKFYLSAAAALIALLPIGARAQTSPGLTQGQKLTPAQWNNLFASKQDTLGFTPMNSAGGVFTGRIVTSPPGASTAGLNLTPGTTPASPANGDLWFTSSSIFARVNGVTFDLIGSPCLNCALTTTANTFTGAPQISQGLTTTQPGWFVQVAGDSVSRIHLGLTALDVPTLSFGSGSATRDAFIQRVGPASLRHGGPDAATAVAQTISVQNIVAGTSNTAAGATLTIAGARGTGTGAGGNIAFQTAPAGSTGSAQNTLVTALTIFGTGGIGTGGATDPGAGNLNLAGGSLLNNGVSPTGTGGYVRATGPTLVGPFAFTLGSDATGDIFYRSSGGVITRLPIGGPANILTVSAGIPAWAAATGGGNVSNTGTPTANQIAQWTNATTVQGVNLASLLTQGNFVSITGTTSPTIAVNAAAKTDQQAGTSNVLAVAPLHQQDHDSAAKAWCQWVGATTGTHACASSYNVTSVTRSSAGTYVLTFTTAFASAGYVCTGNSINSGNNTYIEFGTAGFLAGSVQVFTLTTANTATDPDDVMVTCFGRQ